MQFKTKAYLISLTLFAPQVVPSAQGARFVRQEFLPREKHHNREHGVCLKQDIDNKITQKSL